MHAYVWTPRKTTQLWPRTKPKFSFAPSVSGPYVSPPPPRPLKKHVEDRPAIFEAQELIQTAARLRAEADKLEAEFNSVTPSLGIQLGLLLLTKEDYLKRILKEWDVKGKGEFLKGEFRMNLRNTGLVATSGDTDALFDSWDSDGGG